MATKDEDKQNTPDRVKSTEEDYYKRMTQDNHPDSSAKRNIGPNGEMERRGQKDKLENLNIGGNEATGYGGNDSESVEEIAQGPGFEFEGSDTAMDDNVNGIRSQEQEFDEKNTKPDNADHSRR